MTVGFRLAPGIRPRRGAERSDPGNSPFAIGVSLVWDSSLPFVRFLAAAFFVALLACPSNAPATPLWAANAVLLSATHDTYALRTRVAATKRPGMDGENPDPGCSRDQDVQSWHDFRCQSVRNP